MHDETNKYVGVLVPAGNLIHEREVNLIAPEHVKFQFQNFTIPKADSSTYCAELEDHMQPPINRLRDWGADSILIGCTAATMRCGDPERIAALESLAGIPVTTAAIAVSDAFKQLSVRSLAIATPYGEKGNKTVADFVKSLGIDVVSIEGLEFDISPEIWKQQTNATTPNEVFDFVMSLDIYDADAIFLPCTGLVSLETLQMIEEATGKLAVSSVQAGYWSVLNVLGLQFKKRGYGQLLEKWTFQGTMNQET